MITPRLQEFLDHERVIYTHKTHRITFIAKDLAQADRVPPWEIAKTVVFVGDGAYGMAVLPGSARIDLEELRIKLGLGSIRLASEMELAKLFPDVELGAMPPFGNLYDHIPVYVDTSLADEETIAFNAGTHRDVLHMKFHDFKRFVHPAILSFAFPA
jgi:Ala-tRNA(Pro) deacylase